MYGIKKLINYFKLKHFSDVNFVQACESLDIAKIKKKDGKKLWELFVILKKTNEEMVNHLNNKNIEEAEFLVQQMSMGSFSLGLEYVATYTKNIEITISDNDHDKALKIFDKYQKYQVFEKAEKVIMRYKSRLLKVC